MNSSRIGCLLPLALVACQGLNSGPGPEKAHSVASWPDIPVPQGFTPVEDSALGVVLEAGSYRAGESRFRGRGTSFEVLRYYRERLPQFGWDWDLQSETWTKGHTQVALIIKDLREVPYNQTPGKIEFLLRVQTERAPLNG